MVLSRFALAPAPPQGSRQHDENEFQKCHKNNDCLLLFRVRKALLRKFLSKWLPGSSPGGSGALPGDPRDPETALLFAWGVPRAAAMNCLGPPGRVLPAPTLGHPGAPERPGSLQELIFEAPGVDFRPSGGRFFSPAGQRKAEQITKQQAIKEGKTTSKATQISSRVFA